MTTSLPTQVRDEIVSKDATVYIPAAMHPMAEKYADERFGTVVRPGDMTEEECLARADAIGASFVLLSQTA